MRNIIIQSRCFHIPIRLLYYFQTASLAGRIGGVSKMRNIVVSHRFIPTNHSDRVVPLVNYARINTLSFVVSEICATGLTVTV